MSVSQKSINKAFALGVFGLFAFGFISNLGAKTKDYVRIIGNYNVPVQNSFVKDLSHSNLLDTDIVVGSSWVSGAQTQVLLQSSFSHRALSGNALYPYIYNIDGEVIDYAEMPQDVDISDNTFYYKFLEVGMDWSDYIDYDVNSFPLISYRYSTPLIVNNHSYYFAMRFGISPLSIVNGFEFRSNANCTVYRYGVGLNGVSFPYVYQNVHTIQNAIGIYDVSSSLGRSDGVLTQGVDTDLTPYKFIEYVVMFEQPNVISGQVASLNVDFQLISGLSDVNFSNGYSNGYSDGYNDGKNYVLNNPTEFNLYDYASYLAYGQSKYNEGVDTSANLLSLSGVMNTIFTAPINMFMSIFRSGAFVWTMPTGEVLDLGGLMTFFLTIGIALAIVRLIMKVGGK